MLIFQTPSDDSRFTPPYTPDLMRRLERRGGGPTGESPVLVVSPDRADAVPMLRELLRGDPEIAIIVDRRASDRRTNDITIEVEPPEDAPRERRGARERRRPCSCYLL